MTIQWYPGHIAKAEKQLSGLLKLVDAVIEVIDARLPLSTVNPRLRSRYRDKPTLLLMNKTDLADPEGNRQWQTHFKQQGIPVQLYDASSGTRRKHVIHALIQLGQKKLNAMEARGLKRRPLRVMVVGMPNVGKSMVINSLVARKKTKTGHKAGVTRQSQWVKIHDTIELLDTPGIIPPMLDSEHAGYLLAAVSSVGEAAFDEESAARFLLHHVEACYPQRCRIYYKLLADEPVTLASIAKSRHYRMSGGEIDLLRTAQSVLSDFRQGRWGKLTLEQTPQHTVATPSPQESQNICPSHSPKETL